MGCVYGIGVRHCCQKSLSVNVTKGCSGSYVGPRCVLLIRKFVVEPLTNMFLGLTVALLVGSAMATGFDASNSSAPVESTDHSWRRMLGESHPVEPNLQIEAKFLHLLRTR